MCKTVVATLDDMELHYKQDDKLSFRLSNNVDGGAINEDIVKTRLLQVFYRLRDSY